MKYLKLRNALKLNLTEGPWSAYLGKGGTVAIDIGESPKGKRPCVVSWAGFDQNDLPTTVNRNNAQFIAAASPKVISELLKELDELRFKLYGNYELNDTLAKEVVELDLE